MVLNFRYVADEDYQKIIDLVTATGLEVSVLRTCPPVSNDINAPALQLLQQAFQSVLAHPVRFIRMCGATDARHLRALNIPVAIIGTEGTGAHSAEERLRMVPSSFSNPPPKPDCPTPYAASDKHPSTYQPDF